MRISSHVQNLCLSHSSTEGYKLLNCPGSFSRSLVFLRPVSYFPDFVMFLQGTTKRLGLPHLCRPLCFSLPSQKVTLYGSKKENVHKSEKENAVCGWLQRKTVYIWVERTNGGSNFNLGKYQPTSHTICLKHDNFQREGTKVCCHWSNVNHQLSVVFPPLSPHSR